MLLSSPRLLYSASSLSEQAIDHWIHLYPLLLASSSSFCSSFSSWLVQSLLSSFLTLQTPLAPPLHLCQSLQSQSFYRNDHD